MAAAELNAIARSIVENDQGNPRRRRVDGDDQEALRRDRGRVDRGEPPRLPQPPLHDRRAWRSSSAASSSSTRRSASAPTTVRRSPSCSPRRASYPGSRSTPARSRWPARPARRSRRASTGCAKRLAEYYELGARFAKWRATLSVGDRLPSRYCVRVNAQALARYAALCQEAGIVPIVEPEVLMDTDHSIDACYDVTARTLQALYAELAVQRVDLEGTLLKPNMVIPGKGNADQASPDADRRRQRSTASDATYPRSSPGSSSSPGGQSEVEATANLDAINRLDGRVWPLSFSYGRALQASALQAWRGDAGERGGGAGGVPPPCAVQRSRRGRSVRRRARSGVTARTGKPAEAGTLPAESL